MSEFEYFRVLLKLSLISEVSNEDCTPEEQWGMLFDIFDKEYLHKLFLHPIINLILRVDKNRSIEFQVYKRKKMEYLY